MRQLTRVQGSLLVLLTGTIFSFGPLTFRAVIEADAWQYLFHRGFWSGLVAVLVIRCSGRKPFHAVLKSGFRQQLAGLLLASLLTMFIVALSRTTAAFILLLQCTSPFYAAGFARLFLGERVPRRTLIAMFVAALGVVVMVEGSVGRGDAVGTVLSLLIPVVMGIYTTLIRSDPPKDPGVPIVIAGFSAALVAGLVSMAGPGLELPLRDIFMGFLGGGVLLGCGVPLWNYAQRFVPAAEANLLLVTEIVLAPFWLWIWPGEQPGLSTILGGGVALVSVTWLTFVTARDDAAQRSRRVGLQIGAVAQYGSSGSTCGDQ